MQHIRLATSLNAIFSILFLFALSISGCARYNSTVLHAKEIPVYHDTARLAERNSVRRIVAVVENQTRDNDVGQIASHHLANWIRRQGRYEIIVPPAHLLRECTADSILKGQFSESFLVEMFYKYNADAVLVVSVNEFHAYSPMRLALTMHIVDIRTAEVLASLDGVWNSMDQATQLRFKKFVQSRNQDAYQTDLLLQSPQAFIEFVMSDISAYLGPARSARTNRSSNNYNSKAYSQAYRPDNTRASCSNPDRLWQPARYRIRRFMFGQ